MQSETMLQIFSQNVRRLRLAAGLTQTTLAERCSSYKQHIPHIEDGSANVTLMMIVALAQALEVEPGILLQEIPESPRREP